MPPSPHHASGAPVDDVIRQTFDPFQGATPPASHKQSLAFSAQTENKFFLLSGYLGYHPPSLRTELPMAHLLHHCEEHVSIKLMEPLYLNSSQLDVSHLV